MFLKGIKIFFVHFGINFSFPKKQHIFELLFVYWILRKVPNKKKLNVRSTFWDIGEIIDGNRHPNCLSLHKKSQFTDIFSFYYIVDVLSLFPHSFSQNDIGN